MGTCLVQDATALPGVGVVIPDGESVAGKQIANSCVRGDNGLPTSCPICRCGPYVRAHSARSSVIAAWNISSGDTNGTSA